MALVKDNAVLWHVVALQHLGMRVLECHVTPSPHPVDLSKRAAVLDLATLPVVHTEGLVSSDHEVVI